VFIAQAHSVASSTVLAMKEFVTPTNSTNSTVITMKLFFRNIVVKEFADIAKVFSHIDATIRADFSNLNCF
jgi:hypothetical protein